MSMNWPRILLFLSTCLLLAEAGRRDGVKQVGTTPGGDVKIITGEPLPTCPPSHPFAMAEGSICCVEGLRYPKWIPPAHCPAFSIRINYFSQPAECCRPGDELPCLQFPYQCSSNKDRALEPKLPARSFVFNETLSDEGSSWTPSLSVLLTKECDSITPGLNYYLTPDEALDHKIIMEAGGNFWLRKVLLTGSHNDAMNDRAVKDYTVSVSMFGHSWTTFNQGTMVDARHLGCNVPVTEVLPADENTAYIGSMLMVVLNNFYGELGGALQAVDVEADPVY